MKLAGWRYLTQWLLALGILLQGLGPAFASLTPDGAAGRLQIVVCTSTGMVIMDLPAGDADPDPEQLRIHHTGDCLLCGTTPALLSSVAPVSVATAAVWTQPVAPVADRPRKARLSGAWEWPPVRSPPPFIAV